MNTEKNISKKDGGQEAYLVRIKKDLKKYRSLYFMVLPVIVFYAIFCYKPMYGALIAFQDYTPGQGIAGSNWVGFKHFADFVRETDFLKLVRNTLAISIYGLVFIFPMPIIFALLLNEIRQNRFKRTIQTVSYLPHFISIVVICGMIKDFVSRDGMISIILSTLTGKAPVDMLNNSSYYLPVYIISGIWQCLGWDSIIYVAALAGVDTALYEAAEIDGAGKFKQMLHVTLPGILPTIVIMFILRVGSLLNVGYEKTMLLYNPLIYDRADIISTYVYRLAFEGQQWSYTTAIGLFNSVVNFTLVVVVNKICDRVSGTSLW